MNEKHCFVDGHIEPSVDFDYSAVEDSSDRGSPLESELEDHGSKGVSDAVGLGKLFGIILTYGGNDQAQFFIMANVLVFVIGIHPNQGAGGVVIANGLGMEKANWFRRVNQMRAILKSRGAVLPKIAGMWSQSARKTIKQKTTSHHERRKSVEKITADTGRFSRALAGSGIAD